jgi:hypothetical protein
MAVCYSSRFCCAVSSWSATGEQGGMKHVLPHYHAFFVMQLAPFIVNSSLSNYYTYYRAAKIRSLSHAVRLNVHPFVSNENRDAWQEYTARHNAWVDESMHIQKNDDTMYKDS